MAVTKKEGIDKKYLSVKDIEIPYMQKNRDKFEANINIEDNNLIKYEDKKTKKSQKNPYVHQVNARIVPSENTENGMPKFTFESKEFYNQANHLSSHIPYWS